MKPETPEKLKQLLDLKDLTLSIWFENEFQQKES